jgi:hypothetical protein
MPSGQASPKHASSKSSVSRAPLTIMHQSTDVKPGPNNLTEQLECIVVALKVEAARKRRDKEVGLRSYTCVWRIPTFTRRGESETSHRSAFASGMSRDAPRAARVHHCFAPVSCPTVRCDSDIDCRRPCSSRASARDRAGSKTRSDRDTHDGMVPISRSTNACERGVGGTVP